MRRHRPRATASTRLGAAVAVVALVVAGCGSGDDSGGTPDPEPALVDEGALTVCTSVPYRPFEYKDDGKFVGYDIDMANAVANELRLRPVIKNARFDDIDSGLVLNEGQCDVAVAALSILGERARVMDFSSPYFQARQAMVVQDGSGFTDLGELSGQSIGVQAGTTGQLYVTDNAPLGAEIVPYGTADEVDAALESGEVAAGIYDDTVVSDLLDRYPDFERVQVFQTGDQYGMAVKKDSNVELLRTINTVLARLEASGQDQKIYNKWFGPQSEQ
jgi:polar amino acid transport system substrate-binding protein